MGRWRLTIAIITTFLDEALIIFLIIWGLPRLGVHLPVWVIGILVAFWTAFAVLMYIYGTKALRRKPVGGLTSMVDMKGIVIKTLKPDGQIKIKGEIWSAASVAGDSIPPGIEVTVVGQKGLKLTVRR
jgi:membrane-bound serine protease (ClpP class)